MSILARSTIRTARTALRQQQPLMRRNLHIENTHETTVPFRSGPTRKIPVAIGVSTFLVFGFSLPFIAAKFQIAKASW
ncbi:related to COX8 - cytochrome-c oxidase chain VIII [Melanopsichium pennsylvanicum]|uniref:Cytochrome c oxidase subunit 8, mitochondrial n=1 Tax=Melanopsichium pennsylvanicum TaxID=63383 RepID=A0AAJ5C2G7_9BASI|nr:related to COX8 - cytochrome-c oxidase chain VIII [Melanopsichium pennsylvanicum]